MFFKGVPVKIIDYLAKYPDRRGPLVWPPDEVLVAAEAVTP